MDTTEPKLNTPTERALYRDCQHYTERIANLENAAREVVDACRAELPNSLWDHPIGEAVERLAASLLNA